MKLSRLSAFGLLLVLVAGALAGCAQDVGDIDRTQPNALKKSDFEGEWYIRHTITDVPPTLSGPFVGISSSMEKIRWEVQQDVLIAYRAYEHIPGHDQDAGEIEDGQTQYADGVEEGRDSDVYKEQPIAMYPIVSHFDIQRQYNPSTGEQTNVIVENMSDRPWHERQYMRVNWATNFIDTSFPAMLGSFSNAGFYVEENEDTVESYYTEHAQLDDDEDHELAYFDFLTKYQFGENEVEIRSSFQRLPEYERDYQPAFYDDEMMTKFGYFRTERLTYDRGYGYTDSGIIYLANRHDMWKNDYKRDQNGEYLRTEEGRRIPTPMAEREPKPIVYYLSPNYPERMRPGAEAVAGDWDRAFSRAAAAAKGMSLEDFTAQYGEMFVLCEPVVEEADSDLCDPRPEAARYDKKGNYVPFKVRRGDLRLSTIDWVHQPQAAGPLGYGPSYADPETGEIISGTAYVYGAGVDRYAQRGLDIVRFVNGDLDLDDLHEGDYVREYVMSQIDRGIDPRASHAGLVDRGLADLPVEQVHERLLDERVRDIFADVHEHGMDHMKVDPTYTQRRIQKMKDAGLDQWLIDDEYVRAVAGDDVSPADLSDTDIQDILAKQNPVELHKIHEDKVSKIDHAAKHNIYLEEFVDPAVIGTALRYEGRTDYENILDEIRNEIYRGVMAHEVGHTIGLRHNFQGSYDSVNFFDEYWEMRKENFQLPTTVSEMYEVSATTALQANGDIGTKMYSSIMDYHSRFNGDWNGIGKYDEAAILFAYTFGTYDDLPSSHTGSIPVEEGFVEVFNNLPSSVYLPQYDQNVDPSGLFHSYDDRYASSQHPLEDFHYTTVLELLGGPDNLTDRSLVRYSELRQQQEAGDSSRPVEVQYMFCSDEWVGATISCDRWDLGADPFEVTRSAIQNYKAYYPFTHFRRDRLTFNSLSGAASAARSFNKMPQVYQRWFFNQYYGGDPILSNYFLFGAYSGFNLLAEVLSMPAYGGYEFDEAADEYIQIDRDPNCQEGGDVDMCVRPGNGRTLYSRYDYGSGYYYYSRTTESGHYWDTIFAMQAMTQSRATALGVDVQGDMGTYLLPYYLVFEGNLTEYFNGLIRGDTTGFAPLYSKADGLRFRPAALLGLQGGGALDPLTGEVLNSTGATSAESPVQVRTAWAQRIYSLLYGVAFFNSSYSQHFVDQARIFKLGNGEQLEAPAGSGFEVITFTDPHTGITYGAIAEEGAADEDLSLAGKLIREGQGHLADMDAGDDNAEYRLNNLIEEMNRVIGAVEVLGQERF
jgi:hypothetical protein